MSTPQEYATLSDSELVERVRSGESDAYAELVLRHQASLYRYALGMMRDADLAADQVQDALLKGFTRLDQCGDGTRFGAWVYRILVNGCKDYLKSIRRNQVPVEEQGLSMDERRNPDREMEQRQYADRIQAALEMLPDAQREAFLLKHVEGYSYEEMSDVLGVGISALKMRVMRARDSLAHSLQDLADVLDNV